MLCVWVTAYANACSWIVLARDFSVRARARVCMYMFVLEFLCGCLPVCLSVCMCTCVCVHVYTT